MLTTACHLPRFQLIHRTTSGTSAVARSNAREASGVFIGKLAVDTVLPDARISFGVQTRHDLDTGSRRNEVRHIRESSDARPASVRVDLLEAFWTSPDLLEAAVDSAEKVGPQALGA
jgi:hypothetical protein